MTTAIFLLAQKWRSRGSGVAKLSSRRNASHCQCQLRQSVVTQPPFDNLSPTQDAVVILDSACVLAWYRMRRFYRGLGWQWLLMHTWEILPRVGSDRRQCQINPRLHALNVQIHSESRRDVSYVLHDCCITSRKPGDIGPTYTRA